MVSTKIDIDWLKDQIECGSFMALARALTLVENDIAPSVDLLKNLNINRQIPVIGITGPPGAGKSTLVNAIAEEFAKNEKKVAILAVDPTSPFNYGSLLGDRIRMSKHFNNPNIYIRSVATRGSLGGISAKTIEMVDVLRAAAFDLIIVETVGVGQSEIEIAGLADKTILVLVPEAGDEIQHIKSGLMEIAQAFVVNKADRDGADAFANGLSKMVMEQHQQSPVFKTIADKSLGISDVCDWILHEETNKKDQKAHLLAEQAFKLIQHKKMRGLDKQELLRQIRVALDKGVFNLYVFIEDWI
ncbi:methylmalonyl Co-A mutase-associated GTPase MeaB [Pedobacter sp. SL55]|uniref:methylmalonyl Co-A mutase-associated GTPase MeaB n=1 Tax=Pedobacter sp. SL55 TaxID=2995161 RepID=UPI00226E5105|nr:methylmalonyl Co-A mutase-associated GTPase MeaB [Pedobacter sp. SL55]WAC41740.1 methylmalonyl Co-A mutase-associated GTPase MeaB [Pedobacter sp. SL55]